MLYADHIVLLAENETDLQLMSDTLNRWCICINKQKNVNAKKSQTVHFRTRSVSRSTFSFKYGAQVLDTVDKYVYLGLVMIFFFILMLQLKLYHSR